MFNEEMKTHALNPNNVGPSVTNYVCLQGCLNTVEIIFLLTICIKYDFMIASLVFILSSLVNMQFSRQSVCFFHNLM